MLDNLSCLLGKQDILIMHAEECIRVATMLALGMLALALC